MQRSRRVFWLLLLLLGPLTAQAEILRFRILLRDSSIELRLVEMQKVKGVYKAYIQNGYLSMAEIGYFKRASSSSTSFTRVDDSINFHVRLNENSDRRSRSFMRDFNESGWGYINASTIEEIHFHPSQVEVVFNNTTFRVLPYSPSFSGCAKKILRAT